MQSNQTLNNNENQLLSNLYQGTKTVVKVVASFLKASFDVFTGKVEQSNSPNKTVRNSFIISQIQTDLKNFNHYIYNRHGGYKALATKVYKYLKDFIVNTAYPFISHRVKTIIEDIKRSEDSKQLSSKDLDFDELSNNQDNEVSESADTNTQEVEKVNPQVIEEEKAKDTQVIKEDAQEESNEGNQGESNEKK
mgnify:CR=1 FL=1